VVTSVKACRWLCLDTHDPEALILLTCVRLRLHAAFACVAHQCGAELPELLQDAVRAVATMFSQDSEGAGPASNAGPKRALAKGTRSGYVLL
jgi:hypothetical protein